MTNNRFELAIIIVNYKTPKMVIDVLNSIKLDVANIDAQVLIVDNDSQDDSVTRINEWITSEDKKKKFRLIESSHNSGFSGGNNIGINAVDADYYLLLNSDTIVQSGALESLLETAKENNDAGLVGARLEWPDGQPQESCFHFHTPVSEFLKAASVGLFSRLLAPYIVARPVVDHVESYQWVSFACVLIRSQVIKDIGLLDDEFFMYFEDVEFSYRAQKAGWKVIYQPNAHVVHLRGGSSPLKSQAKLRKKLPRYFYESRTRYFYLVYGYWGLIFANIAWILGAAISGLREKLSKHYQSNTAQGQWRDTWINFTNPLKAYIHPKDYD
ncbi:glycosyl transferase [Methylophaga thalassica]|uniref:Glycosyl transferase n=1 Tax=Methylophaga thalassica TaxID=40223 RepID=A0ABQ5TUG8_9GAMM|nr:glycosyltransferase family 2 protein [Methylophaga thalassica]GLP99811.1 glycosyl transferase [Methylophaga thalassica]